MAELSQTIGTAGHKDLISIQVHRALHRLSRPDQSEKLAEERLNGIRWRSSSVIIAAKKQ
jgi:hypothetical protein